LDRGFNTTQIGIIVFFKAQAERIKEKLDNLEINNNLEFDVRDNNLKQEMSLLKSIQISTIDAFQGAEKDIIIVALSRTSPGSTDFIYNPNRINVALTRAKRHLFIVGKSTALDHNEIWRFVINKSKTVHRGYIDAFEFLKQKTFDIKIFDKERTLLTKQNPFILPKNEEDNDIEN